MKKTKFFITVNESGKTRADLVSGYYDFLYGLPLGVHKVGDYWTLSELSTGLKIASARTRKEAFEKAGPLADLVKETIKRNYHKDIKRMIDDAYAAL